MKRLGLLSTVLAATLTGNGFMIQHRHSGVSVAKTALQSLDEQEEKLKKAEDKRTKRRERNLKNAPCKIMHPGKLE